MSMVDTRPAVRAPGLALAAFGGGVLTAASPALTVP